MAAPSTVYKDYMARRRKGGTTPVDIDLYIAKFLQNTTAQTGDNWGDGYFNAADIPPTAADWSAANANIKAIFKVDGFLCVPKGTTENGFIGFCYSRTSGNGLYHKTERFSGVRVPTTVNASAELLNDGGLNRKGECSFSAVTSNLETNAFIITGVFRSSFFNTTMSYGIMWKKHNDTEYNTLSLGTIGAKLKDTKTAYSCDVDTSDALYIEAPFTYTVNAFITNDEGIKVDATIDVPVAGYAKSFNYDADTIVGAYTGNDSRTQYMTRRTMVIGASFLSDASGTYETPANGVYLDMTTDSLGLRKYYLLEAGIITMIGLWDFATSVQYHLPYMACGSDLESAFEIAEALNFTTNSVGSAQYSDSNGGEWHFFGGVPDEYGAKVFLLEVVGDTPYSYVNSTLYWIQTNSLNLVTAFNVPDNNLDYYISSHGTIIQ